MFGDQQLPAAVGQELCPERAIDIGRVDVAALPGGDRVRLAQGQALDLAGVELVDTDHGLKREGHRGGGGNRDALALEIPERGDARLGDEPLAGGDDLRRAQNLNGQFARKPGHDRRVTEDREIDLLGGKQRQRRSARWERYPLDLDTKRLVETAVGLADHPGPRRRQIADANDIGLRRGLCAAACCRQ